MSGSILPIIAVNCSNNIFFAITNIGTLLAWGSSQDVGTIPDELTNINNAKFKPLISIVSNGNYYIVLKNDGSIYNWGGFTLPFDSKTITNAKKIWAGGNNYGFILTQNNILQVINQTSTSQIDPLIDIPIDYTNIMDIGIGYYHCIGLQMNGTVVGWGKNIYSQITIPRNLAKCVQIAACANYSMALDVDGNINMWGDLSGNLSPPSDLPKNIKKIFAADLLCGIITTDNNLIFWGNDHLPDRVYRSSIPVELKTTDGLISDISLSYNNCIILLSNGYVCAWGVNTAKSQVPANISYINYSQNVIEQKNALITQEKKLVQNENLKKYILYGGIILVVIIIIIIIYYIFFKSNTETNTESTESTESPETNTESPETNEDVEFPSDIKNNRRRVYDKDE